MLNTFMIFFSIHPVDTYLVPQYKEKLMDMYAQNTIKGERER